MSYRKLGKIFVSGADGFIGSHLVETLINEGLEVTALCLYNSFNWYGWLNHLSATPPPNLNLVMGDVRDQGLMEQLIKGHDTVFHLASLIAIPYSYKAPESYIDTNIKGALSIGSACIKAGVGRLIHTSTSEVYGTAKYVPIDEHHPLQGQSPYSASKIGADMMIESFWRSFELPAIILRPFNTFGPRQSLRAVIPTIIAQCLSGAKEIKLGNTTPTRDFNFVTDTVQAFIEVAKSNDIKMLGQVYNSGSGREITIKDLVALIASLLNTDLHIQTEDLRFRPDASEVERLLCNSLKLQGATSWRPAVSLEQGLTKTIEWMRTTNLKDISSKYHV